MRVTVEYTNLRNRIINAETGDEIFAISTKPRRNCTAAEFDKAGEAIDTAVADFLRSRPDLEIVEKIHPNQGVREFPDGTYESL